jgi:hypothetical protein
MAVGPAGAQDSLMENDSTVAVENHSFDSQAFDLKPLMDVAAPLRHRRWA